MTDLLTSTDAWDLVEQSIEFGIDLVTQMWPILAPMAIVAMIAVAIGFFGKLRS